MSNLRSLDCRHGRSLFLQDAKELLVWEPITGSQRRVPLPVVFERGYSTAAVFCAADGCDHRDCLGGPFHVLFVFSSDDDDDEFATPLSACLYSSETRAWGQLTSAHAMLVEFIEYSSVLVASSMLYFIFYVIGRWGSILEYDLSSHSLTVFSTPRDNDNHCDSLYNLVLTEDGELGIIQDLHPHLKLWTREASDGTDARWALSRVISLCNLLPTSARLHDGYRVGVVGFAEGADVIFVSTLDELFAIELQPEQVRKVCDYSGYHNVVPVVTFYTPVPRPRGHHQNLLVSEPGEVAGGEVGGEEEKTVNQAQQLFEHGSITIEEGDFVNTSERIRHDHDISVCHVPYSIAIALKSLHCLPFAVMTIFALVYEGCINHFAFYIWVRGREADRDGAARDNNTD
uniref:F-box protein AT5G49610-like beta-propeller domain-containing protein n=1 Tax=Aegilops tauschii TaxID=37682 RepID=R7VYX0_AEGTA